MQQLTQPPTIIQVIARILAAYKYCCPPSDNTVWLEKHKRALQWIKKNILPSGSGIDSGTRINLATSRKDRIVFSCEFHHMNEDGYYTNWTSHQVIATPGWWGVELDIKGRNQDEIHDVLAAVFHDCLSEPFTDKQYKAAYGNEISTGKCDTADKAISSVNIAASSQDEKQQVTDDKQADKQNERSSDSPAG